jgi:hypothetical protein
MQLEPGQLWQDESGHARICGLVPGWHVVEESAPLPRDGRPDAIKGSVNSRVSNANIL